MNNLPPRTDYENPEANCFDCGPVLVADNAFGSLMAGTGLLMNGVGLNEVCGKQSGMLDYVIDGDIVDLEKTQLQNNVVLNVNSAGESGLRTDGGFDGCKSGVGLDQGKTVYSFSSPNLKDSSVCYSNRAGVKVVSESKTTQISSKVPSIRFSKVHNADGQTRTQEIKTVPSPILAHSRCFATTGLDQSTYTATSRPPILTITSNTTTTGSDNCKIQTSNQIRDFSKLNRSDLDELEQHRELIGTEQIKMLDTVNRKQQLYPQRYRYVEYLQHSSLLLLSNGWSSAQRYSMCGIKNSVNRSGLCRLHKFCPYCSFLEKQNHMARIVPAYESGIWHFLTGSFTGDLTMRRSQDYHDLLHYWDAYKSALQQLVKDKLVRGVFWTEELAVNSMLPVHVLPHIHATIEADELSGDTVQAFQRSVAANLKAALGPDHLLPNVQIKNLNSQRKLLSHVQYQIKPIKLLKPYEMAWTGAAFHNRAQAVQLNSELTDLVLGYSHNTSRRFKINSAGNLSPKAKMYIGTREKQMKAAHKIVQEVMMDGVDYIELNEPEEITVNE